MYDNFHAAAVPRKDLTSRKSAQRLQKIEKPNGIETVKEKHHTSQKDMGLQEYENQEKICKVKNVFY